VFGMSEILSEIPGRDNLRYLSEEKEKDGAREDRRRKESDEKERQSNEPCLAPPSESRVTK